MAQGLPPDAGARFRDQIAEIVREEADQPVPWSEFMATWREFAAGISMTGVGAEIRQSGDGKRYHLVLWPLHRPAWRTHMLTFGVTPQSTTIYPDPARSLGSPAELADWLREFAASTNFRGALQALRAQADEPVEAQLEIANSPDIVLVVSPDRQRALAEATDPIELEVELERGERIPGGGTARRLRSAGIVLDVAESKVIGRRIRLVLHPTSVN